MLNAQFYKMINGHFVNRLDYLDVLSITSNIKS